MPQFLLGDPNSTTKPDWTRRDYLIQVEPIRFLLLNFGTYKNQALCSRHKSNEAQEFGTMKDKAGMIGRQKFRVVNGRIGRRYTGKGDREKTTPPLQSLLLSDHLILTNVLCFLPLGSGRSFYDLEIDAIL